MTKQAEGRGHGVATVTVELPVTGMTCAACEKRVGRALSKVPGVTDVSVSATRGQARVSGSPPPQREALERAVRKAGYHLGRPAWVLRDPRAWLTVAVAAVAVWILVLLVLRVDLSAGSVGADAEKLAVVAVMVLVGLAAGVSTCMALVGGLILAVSAQYARSHPAATATQRLAPQLAFQAGRIAGFAVLGAALGAVGSAFSLPPVALAVLVIAVALVMTLLGLRLTGLSPRLAGWSPTLPGRFSHFLTGQTKPRGSGHWRAAGLGAATFILPCGITQSVQVYALATGSPLMSGAIMGAFAVGTAPGLLALGGLGTLATKSQGFVRVTGVLVIGMAMVSMVGGLRSLGLTTPSSEPVAAAQISDNVTVANGVQTVRMSQTSRGYVPAQSVVYSGLPTKWAIDAKSPFTCSEALRAPDLGVSTYLERDRVNVFDIAPLEPGVYSFNCVMGMYPGEFIAINRP
ncbi:MAG: sulfite exporter TauE/SafE family protein [Candidatus Nanopelagicales bacterium]|nr:sulfite exporter TauE/SafE family protein [Candidatus Nanopelagicales bacterium]MDZ4249357.1 sulfite exporter TauE/SafE family protein [Candidatus Nanopelagicales bacterium]